MNATQKLNHEQNQQAFILVPLLTKEEEEELDARIRKEELDSKMAKIEKQFSNHINLFKQNATKPRPKFKCCVIL